MLAGMILVLFAAAPQRPWAEQYLRDQCQSYAADPKNPWALAHGITGLGKDFVASDGRLARNVIVEDFLLKNQSSDGGPGPGSPWGFLKYGPDGTPIEPHTNLLTKTFVLAGVKPQVSFKTRAKETVTLAQLVEAVKAGFRHVPASDEYWKDVGWTLDLLGHSLEPGPKAKVGATDFNLVMNDALDYLEKAQAEIQAGMEKGLPQVPKRKQGIYAHSCGGLHLVQAVFTWARFAPVKKAWGPRLDKQIDVLFYRLDSERQQYDEALKQAPQYELQILTQMVKFYGHFLETTARLKDENRWKPNAQQTLAINRAKALLDAALRRLDEKKTFSPERMSEIRATQRQVYLDLIGDACHAAHGWEGWK